MDQAVKAVDKAIDEIAIRIIHREDLHDIWDHVESLLERALAHNVLDGLTLNDVAYDLDQGIQKLLIGVSDGKIHAAFTVMEANYRRKQGLCVVLAAGEPLGLWLNSLVEFMDQWIVKDPNKTFYEMIGRRGWIKALKGIAFEQSVIIRREP